MFQDEDADLDSEIDQQFTKYQALSAINQRDKGIKGRDGRGQQSKSSHMIEKMWRNTLSTIFKLNNMMMDN